MLAIKKQIAWIASTVLVGSSLAGAIVALGTGAAEATGSTDKFVMIMDIQNGGNWTTGKMMVKSNNQDTITLQDVGSTICEDDDAVAITDDTWHAVDVVRAGSGPAQHATVYFESEAAIPANGTRFDLATNHDDNWTEATTNCCGNFDGGTLAMSPSGEDGDCTLIGGTLFGVLVIESEYN